MGAFEYYITGRKGEEMFFVSHGRVEIRLPSGEKINEIGDGSYFGGKYIK